MEKRAEIGHRDMMLLGIGWFGMLYFWGFYSGPMPLFLNEFTDSKFAISLVLSLAGFSGCLVPLIVGYLSDRTAGRFGQRRPYIFFGILSASIGVVFLPHVTGLVIVAILSAMIYVSIDAAQTPFMALLPDITPTHQRSTASGVMNLFGGIGLIASFLVGSRIWDRWPAAAFYIVALILVGSVLVSIRFLQEPEALPGKSKSFDPLSHLSSVLRERDAMMFFIAQFFWWLGFWVVAPFLALFVSEELKAPQGQSLLIPMAGSLVQTSLSIPIGVVGDRVGRRGILLCAIAFWAMAEFLVGFSQNSMHAFIAVGLTGIPLAAVMGVGYAYMLDLIPENRTAEFVGLGIISQAAPQIFGPLLGGKLIDAHGYHVIFPTASVLMIVSFVILCFLKPSRA